MLLRLKLREPPWPGDRRGGHDTTVPGNDVKHYPVYRSTDAEFLTQDPGRVVQTTGVRLSSSNLDVAPLDPSSRPDVTPSFDDLYERYGARVLRLIYRMTGNHEVASDLAQDVWIRVHGRLDKFEARADIFTWIYRIAVNRTLNHLSSEKRRRWVRILDLTVGEAMSANEPAPVSLPDTGPPPDRSVEDEQLSQQLWLAIQKLDPMYRVPLVLFHFEDQSYNQIAETMGLSMRAVQARIIRARKQLKKIMGPLVKQL